MIFGKYEKELLQLRKDVVILKEYYIAGRDMHDSVKRFLERRDAGAPLHVTDGWINQMRVDAKKWDACDAESRKQYEVASAIASVSV